MNSVRLRWIIFLGVCAIGIGILWYQQASLAKLFRQACSNDMTVRVTATRTLLDNKILPDGLAGSEVIVYSKIAEALGEIGTPQAITALIKILDNAQEAPARRAKNSLAKIGAPALPELATILSTGSDNQKKRGAETMSLIGAPAIPHAQKLLTDAAAQANACLVLGTIGTTTKDPAVAQAAFAPLIAAAGNADANMANAAIPVLGDKVIQAAGPTIQKALARPELRQNAIVALGNLGDPRVTPDLLPFLKDPSLSLRMATVRTLGQLADARAAAPLVATLNETNEDYRSALVLALQRIGAPAAGLLVGQLKSPSLQVRRDAAAALWGDAVPATIPALQAALADPDAKVRAAAARALGWQGNTAALPILLGALRDKDSSVVDDSVAALAAIGPGAANSLLALFGGDATFALYGSRALIAMGEPAAPALRAALDSANPQTQLWAAITLMDMRDQGSVPKLLSLYKSATGEMQVILHRGLTKLGAKVPELEAGA